MLEPSLSDLARLIRSKNAGPFWLRVRRTGQTINTECTNG